MNRRLLIRCLAMTALAGTFLTGVSSASAADAGSDVERVWRVGDTLRYDSGLKVTFLAVKDDNRCPLNAQCASAGDATVVLRVKIGNEEPRKVRIHTNAKPRKVVISANTGVGIPKSYVIGNARLTPLPTAGKTTPQSDYRLKLSITVAQ